MFMQLLRFAWRNIWRNRRRTLLTTTAMAVGIASLVFFRSYIAGIMQSAGEEIVRTESGHVRIINREFLRLERIMPRNQLVGNAAAISRLLQEQAGMKAVMERIKMHMLISHAESSETIVGIGIDPPAAERAVQASRIMREGRYLSGSGQEVIIGRKLARKLGVGVGGEVLLVTSDINFSTYALAFRVVGLFETGFGYYDKNFVYLPLDKAREMLDCGDAVHEFLVYLREPDRAREEAASLRKLIAPLSSGGSIAVIPWQEHDFTKNLVPYMDIMASALTVIIMLIVGLVILNTMLMTVMERYQEIGVIKALGFHDREVTAMILVEAFCIGLVGALAGGLIGGAISAYLERVGMSMADMMGKEVFDKIEISLPLIGDRFYPDFSIQILVTSILFGVLTALLAVLYPVFKSWRMKPVDAFRSELKV